MHPPRRGLQGAEGPRCAVFGRAREDVEKPVGLRRGDPPAGKRLIIPDLPDAKQVLQNEEHLVLEVDDSSAFQPGDHFLAIPRHVCPTTALYQFAYVVTEGELVDQWQVAARDRILTI